MPVTGNQDNIQLLSTCVDNFLTNKESQHSFFIVSGPQHIGKSSAVQEIARERIGQFFYHDFLHIRDLSEVIGKKHSLKIETPKDKEDRYISITDDQTYEDIGIREINHRLQQSSLGKFKILLIENIERIVPAAANAFLKNLEEPLPGRLIIATVSHSSQLLDTIISRALVIRFKAPAAQLLEKFMDTYPDAAQVLGQSGHITQKQEYLKKIYESGVLPTFIDGRIAYCAHHHLPSHKRLEAKKLINANVNVENVLLYAVL